MPRPLSRRRFLRRASGSAAVLLAAASCSDSKRSARVGIVRAGRPVLPCGVQSGDVTGSSAMVWGAADRPARMVVEWSTVESMKDAVRVAGPAATPETGLTAKLDLRDLPPNQRLFYRVRFADLDDPTLESEPVTGTFKTAPLAERDVKFIWSGDTAGQGWGINPDFGGMRIYETMLRHAPDFFIHSGDTIYADNPILPEVKLDDGSVWRNLTTPAKSKVAETLDEFRGNHAYNFLDEHLRRFNASVPILYQWDDHEVRNNWYPGQVLTDPAYKVERRCDVLAARARRAFLEAYPIRPHAAEHQRIYRAYAFGPLVEVFLLDERSYRGKNSRNLQPKLDADSAFLGPSQLQWLKDALASSKAVWKVIASDMPLSYVARDGENCEAWANGDKALPLGRELELASLLSFMKAREVRNVVWLTADVHHAAALRYEPDRAAFKDFDPFEEFVSGPLHAGTFGPAGLDATFGPERSWISIPRGMKGNRPPSDGLQFFGVVRADAASKTLTVEQFDITGRRIYQRTLEPTL